MRYVSLFSGIEAASVAWGPLGWEPVAFAEIDPFPCAVLAQRFPDVPNLGDVTKIDWSDFLARYGAVDLVCGGSPCQSFSIAGGRESLDGESRLMFEYIRACDEVRPPWVVWENVPGVFSIDGGRAFGILIDALEKLGYGVAWGTLDSQFFGVAQRRRRVWLVGHLGDMRAAAVLFDADCLRGNTITSSEKRERLTRSAQTRDRVDRIEYSVDETESEPYGFNIDPYMLGYNKGVSVTLTTSDSAAIIGCTSKQANAGISNDSIGTLTCSADDMYVMLSGCGDITGPLCARDYKGVGNEYVQEGKVVVGKAYTVKTRCGSDTYIKPDGKIGTAGKGALVGEETAFTLSATQDKTLIEPNADGYIVRRLTPKECERLQGFPDGWTDIEYRGKPAADGPRYKALGNSWAVPCARWVGERIEIVEKLTEVDI